MKFRLATILLVLVIIALPIAARSHRSRWRQRVEELSKADGGWVNQYPLEEKTYYSYANTVSRHSSRSSWRELVFGPHFDDRLGLHLTIATVEQATQWNELLSQKRSARGLSQLCLVFSGSDSPFNYRVLSQLDDLRLLEIRGGRIDFEALAAISEIEDLEILWLSGSELDLHSIGELGRCKHLAWLALPPSTDNADLNRVRQAISSVYVTVY